MRLGILTILWMMNLIRGFRILPILKLRHARTCLQIHNAFVDRSLSTLKQLPKELIEKDIDFTNLKYEMIDALQNNDFNSARKVYLDLRSREYQWTDNKSRQKKVHSVLLMFLNMCNKYEHIPFIVEILEFMDRYRIPLTEQIYHTLIKCHIDDKNVMKVHNLITDMKRNKITVRYRSFIPLFEHHSNVHDLLGFLESIRLLEENNLFLKSEECSLFLQSVYKGKNSPYLQSYLPRINQILRKTSEKLVGMDSIDMINVAKCFHNLSYDQVKEQGILIRDKNSINGPILSLKDYETNASIVALNATFEDRTMDFVDERMPVSYGRSPSMLFSRNVETVKFVPTVFIDGKKRQDICSNLFKKNGSLLTSTSLRSSQSDVLKKLTMDSESNARLMYISSNSNYCPCCSGELQKFHLTSEQKQQIRESLYAATSERSAKHTEHLEEFESWIADKDFDYIIDGANVAYDRQNYGNGRFSYKQVFYPFFLVILFNLYSLKRRLRLSSKKFSPWERSL
jgi:hypothetical protein